MSSDDVEIIDVDDEDDVWAPPTPPPPPPPRRADTDAGSGRGLATRGSGVSTLPPSHGPLSSSAAVAACSDVEAKLRALPLLRAAADAQTDPVSGEDAAAAAQTAALHTRLQAMESALGIRGPPQEPAMAPSPVQAAVRDVAAAWREAAASWKRNRPAQETAEDPLKHVKQEGRTQAPVWLPEGDAAPAWASGLEAALDRCGDLLASSSASRPATGAAAPLSLYSPSPSATPSARAAEPRELQRDSRRSAPHGAPTQAPLQPPRQTELDAAATGEAAASFSEPETALLREAQLVCAREHQTSLLPLYTELHALRRQRGERERHAAETVAKQLEWEQRRLSDILTECDAQLDMLEGNFGDACRGRLAPLEALQQRMEVLQEFRRKLDAHATALAPLAARSAAGGALETADGGTAAPSRRPVGVVGEVLSRYMEEERRGWERATAALQARLDEQTRRNEELQACYVQANAKLQASLDRDNYVNKDVIAALKAQQQVDVAALVRHLGWILVNSTTDVLSLRHPVTGATLHTNHAYSTINGQTCEDVPIALAAYLVKHGKATGAAPASPAPPPPPAATVHVAQPAQLEVRAPAEATAAQGHEKARAASPAEAATGDADSSEHAAHNGGSQPPSSDASPEATTEEEAESGEDVEGDEADAGSATSPPGSEVAAASSSGSDTPAHEGVAATPASCSSASGGDEEGTSATAEDEEADAQGAQPDVEPDDGSDDGSEEAEDSSGDSNEAADSSREEPSARVESDAGEDEEAAEEPLVGYSNAPTEEESALSSSRVESSGVAAGAGPREHEQATTAASTPYESFFASQLWDNDAE